jgi:hypothetical protein
MTFRIWEYRKGFMKKNGKMVYGMTAMLCYTLGYIKYHLRRIVK